MITPACRKLDRNYRQRALSNNTLWPVLNYILALKVNPVAPKFWTFSQKLSPMGRPDEKFSARLILNRVK